MSDAMSFRNGKIVEGMSLWESPITQISTQLEQKMREEEDKLVIEVSQMIGYDVNKEELLKALKYSQEQFGKGYDKGYERGYAAGYSKAISDFADHMRRCISEGVDSLDKENSCVGCEYWNAEYGGCDCGHLCIYKSEFVPKKKEE